MSTVNADVAVLGAGFGGILTALLCRRIGLKAVLVEQGTHPRFAIGESSTPIADLVLSGLCDRYDLPRIRPMTHYGTWKKAYPDVSCGLKRGFSYFQHQEGRVFAPRDDHSNELLVAANPSNELGDTHWYRPDVDHFFLREAVSAGVDYLDRTTVEQVSDDDPWIVRAQQGGSPVTIRAPFLVDATGANSVIARSLGLRTTPDGLRTHSRSVFSHFTEVARWHDIYLALGGQGGDHPFDCDDAALHHVFEGGWMWVLRLDNGITSAGFVLAPDFPGPVDRALSPADEWVMLLSRFPSISKQFAQARSAHPLQRTTRLQRRVERAAGRNWAMLPHAAYFIDAFFSGGNAHTLVGIERLIRILEETGDSDERSARLVEFDRLLQDDIDLVDGLIHGAYRGFARFDLMVWYSMLYFAAATFSEEERRARRWSTKEGFLLSHDSRFQTMVKAAHDRVSALACDLGLTADGVNDFAEFVRESVSPYNRVGLADAAKRNMYAYESSVGA